MRQARQQVERSRSSEGWGGVGAERTCKRVAAIPVLLVLLSLIATPPAEAEIPTVADFADCNREAPQAAKAGTVSPTARDQVRADSARASGPAPDAADLRSKGVESPDPQIHGMETEGSRDAAYQAAYRSCMRRKGF